MIYFNEENTVEQLVLDTLTGTQGTWYLTPITKYVG